MKLYTKKGDDGTTRLIGNVRVSKDNARVAAYGAVDETNAAIGLALAVCNEVDLTRQLQQIQADLFVVGAVLATPAGQTCELTITAKDVKRLETWIDDASDKTEPLSSFILPGGSPLASALHFARGVCRRAERVVVSLAASEEVGENILVYLNRLADLLFALARVANKNAGVADVPWNPSNSKA